MILHHNFHPLIGDLGLPYSQNYNQVNKIYRITYYVIMSERSERSSYQQSYIGHLDDIQTALKPLQKSEKIETNFHGHFRTS